MNAINPRRTNLQEPSSPVGAGPASSASQPAEEKDVMERARSGSGNAAGSQAVLGAPGPTGASAAAAVPGIPGILRVTDAGVLDVSQGPLSATEVEALAQDLRAQGRTLRALRIEGRDLTATELSCYVASRDKSGQLNQTVRFPDLEVVSLHGSRLVDDDGRPADAFATVLQKISYEQFKMGSQRSLFDLRLTQEVDAHSLKELVSDQIQHGLYYRRPTDGNGMVLVNPARAALLRELDVDVAALLASVEIPTKEPGTHATPFVPCSEEAFPAAVGPNSGGSLGGSTGARRVGTEWIVKGRPKKGETTIDQMLQLRGEFLGLRMFSALGIVSPTSVVRKETYGGAEATNERPLVVQQAVDNVTALAVALTGVPELDEKLCRAHLPAIVAGALINDTDVLGLTLANAMVPNAPNGAPDRGATPILFDRGAAFFFRAGGRGKPFGPTSAAQSLRFYAEVGSGVAILDMFSTQEVAAEIRKLAANLPTALDAMHAADEAWRALRLAHDPVADKPQHAAPALAAVLTQGMASLLDVARLLEADGGSPTTSAAIASAARAVTEGAAAR